MKKGLPVLLLIVLSLAAGPQASAQHLGEPVPLIPREILFGNPEKTSPQLSADGKQIAFLAPYEGVLNIWVQTIGKEDAKPVTNERDRPIRSFGWLAGGKRIIYSQDIQGNENWRLYLIDVNRGEIRDLTPYPGVQVNFLASSWRFPQTILVQMNKDNPSFHDVYRVDLKTGFIQKIEANPGDVSSWYVDERLAVIGKMVVRRDGGSEFYYRRHSKDPWRKIIDWKSIDSVGSSPIAFTRDRKYVYLYDSTGSDTLRLLKMNLETAQLETIDQDHEWDVGGVTFSRDNQIVQMISFNKETVVVKVLDPAISDDVKRIKAIQQGDFFIIARSHSDKRWLIGFNYDSGPISYYWYDRTTKKAVFLFDNRPKLKSYKLSQMQPVHFQSRDGLTIYGYMTYPVGVGYFNLPMVVLVHGGPWSRNSWGYDAQAQWLANRGYICFQINFRGSTGFGKAFVNKADKQWGAAMQDDLTDGVKWAIGSRYANPRRIAMFGASYGGYAALCAASFPPDLYRAAVAAMGPSNLITFLKSIPVYWEVFRQEYYARVGNPDTEQESLKSRSPFFYVDHIKIPVLIVQGANDPRVNKAESEQIVEAMKKKGIAFEYLLFPDEGHGLVKPANRMKFYTACERFLSRYLGGRYEE